MLLTSIWYAMAFAGGLALVAAPFTRISQAGPHWIRIALWISGPAGLGWSVLGFALHVGSGSLSKSNYDLFVHFKTLFAGMVIAVLVLLSPRESLGDCSAETPRTSNEPMGPNFGPIPSAAQQPLQPTSGVGPTR
jgi:hypothetical protein